MTMHMAQEHFGLATEAELAETISANLQGIFGTPEREPEPEALDSDLREPEQDGMLEVYRSLDGSKYYVCHYTLFDRDMGNVESNGGPVKGTVFIAQCRMTDVFFDALEADLCADVLEWRDGYTVLEGSEDVKEVADILAQSKPARPMAYNEDAQIYYATRDQLN